MKTDLPVSVGVDPCTVRYKKKYSCVYCRINKRVSHDKSFANKAVSHKAHVVFPTRLEKQRLLEKDHSISPDCWQDMQPNRMNDVVVWRKACRIREHKDDATGGPETEIEGK